MHPQDTPCTKICTMCGEEKPCEQFSSRYSKKKPRGRRGYCKKCEYIIDAAKKGKLPTGPTLEKYELWKERKPESCPKNTPEQTRETRRRQKERRKGTASYALERERAREKKRVKGLAIKNSIMRDGCILCGENEIACLDFHHIDPETKEYSVSQLLRTGSFSRAASEIEKCIVLCANCHRKLHAGVIALATQGDTPT